MSTDLAVMPKPSNPLNKMSDVVDIVQHLGELWDLGKLLVESGMLPNSIKQPGSAVAIMLKGRELGLGPMASFDFLTVIQGKPAASPQCMLALINKSGLCEDYEISDDGEAAFVTMKRKGRKPHTERFGMDDAKKFMTSEGYGDNKRSIPLADKANWKSQPRVMRKWRCVAACSRVVFPDVIGGLYTPDELGAEVTVTDDGEVIEAEVVERPMLQATASPTGRGSGLFTKEHGERTAKFNAWIGGQCKSINERWQDEWEQKADEAMKDGLEFPSKIDDVINPWQAKAHLVKWAVESERLDPTIVPEDTKTRQNDALVALVYYRSPEDKAAVVAEMADYLRRQRQIKSDVIYRKHPDLAPAGWLAEQQEVAQDHGDACEGPDATREEALANGIGEAGR